MAEADTDGQTLRRHRKAAGLSLQGLAETVHYDKGYLSRVENDRQVLSTELARVCDTTFGTGTEFTDRAIAAAARARRDLAPLAQLPAAPTHLVGRDAQLRRLGEMLTVQSGPAGAVSVVCIDGAPGVGKTALALRYAHSIVETFPGGTLFAALRGYGANAGPADPSEILDGFLRAMGAHPERIPSDQQDRARLFRSMVAGRGVLMVLDNAIDSTQVQPLLPGTADCAVLVTSRSRLTGLLVAAAPASCLTLDALGPADALELISSVIGTDRADAEPHAVQVVARRCAYLPLALRIAAVRIAGHPQQTVTDLAADLEQENARLDVLEVGELAETTTVRSVFSWSYQALPAPAARLFRLLGLHPGQQFSLGVAAALAGVTWPAARRLLTTLADAHLVEEVVRDRYQMHDLLRVYAAEQARLDGQRETEDAARRLVDWYLASIDAAVRVLTPQRPHPELPNPAPGVDPVTFGPDGFDDAMAWCNRELRASLSITHMARDHRFDEHAWQIPVTWLDYLLIVRPWDEWIQMHEVGVQAAARAGNVFGQGWALTNLAEAHRRRHDPDTAQTLFEEALRIVPGRTGRGWVLAGLAFTAYDRGDYEGAVRHLKQMAAVFEEINMVFGVAVANANLGDAYRELGQLDQAWLYGKRAHALCLSTGDRHAQAYVLPRLARTTLARGNEEATLDYCEEAVRACRETGDRWSEADALDVRGLCLAESGDDRAATAVWLEALAMFDGLDDRRAAMLRARLSGINNAAQTDG